jgi:hypothetical protein
LQGGSLTDTVAQFDREGGSLLPDRRLSKTEIFKKSGIYFSVSIYWLLILIG